MPCYHPLPAWYAATPNPSGKRGLVFKPEAGPHEKRQTQVPCGTCIGCQLEKARQWALRCMHETQLHEDSHFLTLTYDQAHLPPNGSLQPKHLQDFLKRLRFHSPGHTLRYFACGEYGDQLGRPHYHAILWGLPLSDKICYAGDLSISPFVNTVWGHGNVMIGNVTFQSAGYVARYALKKVRGTPAVIKEHYGDKHPEFLRMSRRPGIGRGWAEKYIDEIQSDTLIVNGAKCKPPRYYDDYLAKHREAQARLIKERRKRAAAASIHNTGRRLIVRENVKTSRINQLRRTYEGS